MKQIRQRIDSDWILYHGTSSMRLGQILSENRLRVSPTGPDRKIALTTELSAAEYFACNAVVGDRPDKDSVPKVLVLDGRLLLALSYSVTGFSDPIYGEGECDWENEIACWEDIVPLDEVLIETRHVRTARLRHYRERGKTAFITGAPALAEYELTVMADTVGKLEDGEITLARANAISAAMRSLRRAVGSPESKPR